MEESLREKFGVLLQLQEVEMEMDSVRTRLQSLPGKIAAVEAGLEHHKQSLAGTREHLAELQRRYRSQELQSKEQLAGIARSQEKLHAVKTNKEYQSMLKQIDDLKASHSALEDQMIECLDRIDQAEAALKQTTREAEQARARIAREKAALEEQTREEGDRLKELESRRAELLGAVSPDLLRQYLHVQSAGRRGPVAIVKKAVCQGCHLNIPPQMFNELLRFDRVLNCPHCERLLVPESE